MANKWQVIGICGMDTAELLIVDPCYLNWPKDNDEGEGVLGGTRHDFIAATPIPPFYHQLKYTKGHDGLGVLVHSPHGDGTVVIWGKIDKHGRVRAVFFSFDNEEP